MGSPPSHRAALDIPPFTPSHHLKDDLLTFTDLLLSNIEEWNKPHPFWPPPPPSVSFSGSGRFIKGLLPHRTLAISASLSSLIPDTLLNCCKDGDGHDRKQADTEPFEIHDVTQLPVDHEHNRHDQMQVDTELFQSHDITCSDDDVVTPAAHSHSEILNLPSNGVSDLNLNPSHSQADKSLVDRHLNESVQEIVADSLVNSFEAVRAEDDNNCTYSPDADFLQIHPSHGSSEVVFPVDGPNNGLCEVVAAERLEKAQAKDLDRSFSAMELTENNLQNAEAPCNSQLNEQVDDLEEGELSERFSDDQQSIVKEGDVESVTNIQESRLADGSDVQECNRSPDAGSLSRKVVECGMDEEMNGPISSFVSGYHPQSLNFANQKLSLRDPNGETTTKRSSGKNSSSEVIHQVLEERSQESTGKPEQVKILQEGLRVSDLRDVMEAQRLVETESGFTKSSMNMAETSVSIDNGRIDGVTCTPNVTLEQQGYGESQQPEGGKYARIGLSSQIPKPRVVEDLRIKRSSGLSPSVADKASCLPMTEAGKVEELASLKVAKKKQRGPRGPLTEERKRKRQRGKHRAQDRKLAQLGIRKLKFKPCVEKTKERQKKTCPYYVKGRCSRGTSCSFAHDVTPITKSEMCKYFVMNCCLKGDDCPFSHTLSSFPCKFFHTRGHCLEGDSCRFSHEPMNEDAKREYLQKLEEEQKVRQGVSGVLGRASSVKGKEAVTESLQVKHVDGNEYSTLMAARKAASVSTIGPINAANKIGKKSPIYGGLRGATEPSLDRGYVNSTPATRLGGEDQQKALAASVSGNSATQERRTKAEAFLQAQLELGGLSHRSRLAIGLEKANKCSGSSTNQLKVLPMGHATSIRVSSMSPSCKLNAKPVNAHDFIGHQERGLKDRGAVVPKSSPTLLDLLLRPHEKALSKESPSTLRTQPTEANTAVFRSASSVFLDK